MVSVGVRRLDRSPNTAMACLDDDVVSVGVRRQSRSPPGHCHVIVSWVRGSQAKPQPPDTPQKLRTKLPKNFTLTALQPQKPSLPTSEEP